MLSMKKKIVVLSVICFVNSFIRAEYSQFSLDPYALAKDDLGKDVKLKLNSFAQSAYSTLATVHSSYKIALNCVINNIPGDFVECGVANGTQIAAMAYAAQSCSSKKKIHLFDSFEGIPLAGPNDDQQPGIGVITHSTQVSHLDELLVSSGVSICSVENVQKNMFRWGIDSKNLVYHKGWFQYTLPVKAPLIKKICFLRLDGDLYESTKVCLEFLYPKVSKGGYIVVDDYSSLSGCRKAVMEYLEAHNLSPVIVLIPGGQGPVYWQVQ